MSKQVQSAQIIDLEAVRLAREQEHEDFARNVTLAMRRQSASQLAALRFLLDSLEGRFERECQLPETKCTAFLDVLDVGTNELVELGRLWFPRYIWTFPRKAVR